MLCSHFAAMFMVIFFLDREKFRSEVIDMIGNSEWGKLLSFDELNREIASGRVLNGFTPLQPAFPPTFKRTREQVIKHTYDNGDISFQFGRGQSSAAVKVFYDPKRIPSYTDRILYKSLPAFAGCLKPRFFMSCEGCTSSDHKPVQAGFELNLSGGSDSILIDREVLKNIRDTEFKLSLSLKNLCGENLEEMDEPMFGGGSDPYIVVTSGISWLLLTSGFASECFYFWVLLQRRSVQECACDTFTT